LELTQETSDQVAAAVATTTTTNFTQAALVLHNSSGIYSRKVDYLHNYTYRVQEELNLHHQAKNGNGRKEGRRQRGGNDADVDEFYAFDPMQQFLLLDDVLPVDVTEQRINLTNEGAAATRYTAADAGSMRRASMGRTRLSIGGGGRINGTATNASSWMDGSGSSNSQAALLQRAVIGTLDRPLQGSNGSLRLTAGSCDIGDDGVLRMPGSQCPAVDAAATSTTDFSQQQHAGAMDVDRGGVNEDGLFGGGGGDLLLDYDGDDDHDNEHHGGFVAADRNSSDDGQGDGVAVPEHANNSNNAAGPKRVTFAAQPPASNKPNPWAMLDRDTVDTSKKARPLRIGKTIVLPPYLDSLPSDCVTGSRTVVRNSNTNQMRHRRRLPLRPVQKNDLPLFGLYDRNPVPMKGLMFGREFEYIAKASAKRRADEQRALRLEQQRQQQQQNQVNFEDDVDDDENDHGFGGGGNVDYEDDGFDFGGGGGDNDILGHLNSNTGIASVDEIYQRNRDTSGTSKNTSNEDPLFAHPHCADCRFVVDAVSFADANDTNDDGPTFEDLCRAHIQAFARGAEKYAAETKLSARVSHWQENLAPILEEEERRPVFDIRAYGNEVIQTIERNMKENPADAANHIVDFAQVARNRPTYDVCRLFLATLSLNNAGNVRFVRSDSTLTSVKVELVSGDVDTPIGNLPRPECAARTLGVEGGYMHKEKCDNCFFLGFEP
jgi:condensin-2 complex subunit H2